MNIIDYICVYNADVSIQVCVHYTIHLYEPI